jgi:serine/threonine-protein kinase RsbW
MRIDLQDDGEPSDARHPGGGDADHVVELEIPLHHRHASTVRVVAASLAANIGFSVDEIEDLRLGIDEAVSVMADVDGSPGSRLHLRFVMSERTVTVVVARTGVEHRISAADVDQLAKRILHAVVDRFDVRDDGAFVVSKRATGVHVD